MNPELFYSLLGIAIWLLGLSGLLLLNHPVRRIIAINLMGAGVFLVLIAQASAHPTRDPVLQALVVTGLVVAVSATAFALRLSNAWAQHQRAQHTTAVREGDAP